MTVDQQFRVVWWNDIDSIVEEIDNLYVFTPVRPIDTSDDIKRGIQVIEILIESFQINLGYKWDSTC
jgi:hypothetical protein